MSQHSALASLTAQYTDSEDEIETQDEMEESSKSQQSFIEQQSFVQILGKSFKFKYLNIVKMYNGMTRFFTRHIL
jgi:hypothetical protein